MGTMKDKQGWLVDTHCDDGVGHAVWFDNEQDAIDYENSIWERGYMERASLPEKESETINTRYPIQKCTTSLFSLSFEYYAQGRDITGKPPYSTSYDHVEWANQIKHAEWNEAREKSDDEN